MHTCREHFYHYPLAPLTSAAPANKVVFSPQKKVWYNMTDAQSVERLTFVRLRGGGDEGGAADAGSDCPRSTDVRAQKA